jgi:hypothetical protein
LGLDPATVPFRKRTLIVLRREHVWNDITRLDNVTEAEVMCWWFVIAKGPP